MDDAIEPTAIIGPDGTLRTGWERPPEPTPHNPEFDANIWRARHTFVDAYIRDPKAIIRLTGL